MKMYTVFDSKAQAFGVPFACPNDGIAIRQFAYAAGDRSLDIGRFPEDYSLFYIGEFHETTGEFSPVLPSNLGLAAAFIKES